MKKILTLAFAVLTLALHGQTTNTTRKISELPSTAALGNTDQLVLNSWSGGAFTTKRIAVGDFQNTLASTFPALNATVFYSGTILNTNIGTNIFRVQFPSPVTNNYTVIVNASDLNSGGWAQQWDTFFPQQEFQIISAVVPGHPVFIRWFCVSLSTNQFNVILSP